MVIHLYSLTDGPADVAGLTGVDGAPLRPVACGPLHAVVSDHQVAPEASREHALAHAAAVADVCHRAAALPVRFGAQHAGEASLRRAVAERADALTAAIDRLGGHLELVVRRSWPPVSEPTPVPTAAPPAPDVPSWGRRYLEHRLREERAGRAVHEAVRDELRRATGDLGDVVVDVSERDGPAGPEQCLLVPARCATEVVERIHARLDACAEAGDRLLVGGPWPPYSFAGDLT